MATCLKSRTRTLLSQKPWVLSSLFTERWFSMLPNQDHLAHKASHFIVGDIPLTTDGLRASFSTCLRLTNKPAVSRTNMSSNNSGGNQSNLVVQLAAISAKLDSLIALKEDVAVIKAWMDDKEPQDELQHLPTDLVKEEASGDSSSDDHIGLEHALGDQKVVIIPPIVKVLPLNTKITNTGQILAFIDNCLRNIIKVRTISPHIKCPNPIARGQPHGKTIGYEKFGKQHRPPERIQRIDDALLENQNSATFHHLAIEPYKEQFTGWVAPFSHTRLEGKSFFRARSIDTNSVMESGQIMGRISLEPYIGLGGRMARWMAGLFKVSKAGKGSSTNWE
ncbi:hypothetical protein E3N88_03762 [Mikania micrantha]|uniref:Uncharacterized protein n=1 Tax=Mikania micrantha TaxID=192012 RepID=A0A5N6PSD9_9ASTR|nr:hypothetical protein E3N88_03762 [Mikania micrantha]